MSTAVTLPETVRGVIDALKLLPQDAQYNPGDPTTCPLCKILRDRGATSPVVNTSFYTPGPDVFADDTDMPEALGELQDAWMEDTRRVFVQGSGYCLTVAQCIEIAEKYLLDNPEVQ